MNTLATEIPASTKTVLWDLDGTALNSFGMYAGCLNDVFRSRGMPEAPEELLRQHHHGFIEDSIVRVAESLGVALNDEQKTEVFAAFYALDNACITSVDEHIFDDAAELARRAHLAGMRQLVVTNRPHGTDRGNGSPRNIVAQSMLRPYISDVLCGDVHRKPGLEILTSQLEHGLDELGEVIVVGDQAVDAMLARNLGCSAILVSRSGEIPYMDDVADWRDRIAIVPSLFAVGVAR